MFSKDNIFAEYKKQKLLEMEKTIKVSVDDDEEEKVEAETEADGEESEGGEQQGSEMDSAMAELQRARMAKEKEEEALKEKLRKRIAQLASKYPEGSTWFCDKVNKKVKVLSVGDGIIKVGNGNKTLDCKPGDLSAVKEDVSIEEKGKGLWANIHAKRKRGEKPAKPGDPDYPETLDIEDVEEDNPCWDGYKKVPGKKDFEPGSCEKEEVEEAGYMDQPETKAEVDKKDYDKPEGDSRDKQVLKIKEALKEMKIKKLDKATLDMLKSLDDDEARLIIQGLPSSLRRKAMKELGLKEKVDGRTKGYKETAGRLMAKKEVKEDVSPEDEEEFHKKLDDLVHNTFGKGEHEKEMDESTKKYAKTLQTLADKAKKEKITPKDLATLDKLASMMKNANEETELGEDLTEIIEWSNNFRFVTLTEKRAFIFAAAQAKADGKKTFTFHGKEYAVKIKGGPTVEASPVEEDEDEDKK